ncbi:hypothetical protein DF186_20120, partial [Enterococcus hirae]
PPNNTHQQYQNKNQPHPQPQNKNITNHLQLPTQPIQQQHPIKQTHQQHKQYQPYNPTPPQSTFQNKQIPLPTHKHQPTPPIQPT